MHLFVILIILCLRKNPEIQIYLENFHQCERKCNLWASYIERIWHLLPRRQRARLVGTALRPDTAPTHDASVPTLQKKAIAVRPKKINH